MLTAGFQKIHSMDRVHLGALSDSIEYWLERKRDQLPLLIPLGLAGGIISWHIWGDHLLAILLLFLGALLCFAAAVGWRLRYMRLAVLSAMVVLAGFGSIAFKSSFLAAPPLEKMWIGKVHARVTAVEDQSARDIMRLTLETDRYAGLPERVRVNLPIERQNSRVRPGAIIAAKLRLLPPPGPALPGGYDFSRTAWFQGLGATGSVLGDLEIIKDAPAGYAFWANARNDLADHIQKAMPGNSGPIGAALLVGSTGAISAEDNEALRGSGMAHLLSVSGLHVTAVVGGVFFIISRLFSLFPWFALRVRVPVVAATFSALAALLYTSLTGAEVPTVRACVAALLILGALVLRRESLSMRLLAFGATVVLLFWPEALAGPSFQLSFAAVGTIIALHENRHIRRWTERRDEHLLQRISRVILSLFVTGLAIEIVLAPIALFHFHKSGVYGAFANIVAIPLTTFLVMPLQMIGLLFDLLGVGTPFWWLAGQGVEWIRMLAYWVASAPGATMLLPSFPAWALGAMALGVIWIIVIGGRSAIAATALVMVGAGAMILAPRPDMLVTGDGQHLAVIDAAGELKLLRPRAGDFAVSQLTENAALMGEPAPLETMKGALCNADACTLILKRGAREWTVLATRSSYLVPVMEMAAACKRSDIVVSNRTLPYSCKPRWLKADRAMLERTGGLAFYLKDNRIVSVAENIAHYPWARFAAAPSGMRPHDIIDQ
jgi:competence protein ComEC